MLIPVGITLAVHPQAHQYSSNFLHKNMLIIWFIPLSAKHVSLLLSRSQLWSVDIIIMAKHITWIYLELICILFYNC